jgi:hypothetical protein
MSYRNPQIIVDRSAEIWAQGVSKIGETVAAGITDYYKAKKIAEEKQNKIDEANNRFLVNTELQYDKEILKAVSGVKDDRVKSELTNIFQEKSAAAMTASAELGINTNLSKQQRQEYRKSITDFQSYMTNTKNQINNISTGAQEFNEATIDQIVNGHAPASGDEVSNLIGVVAISGRKTPGIESEVSVIADDNNSNILTVNSRIKVGSEVYNKFKESGQLDEYEESDGYVNVKFERDLSKWDGTFFQPIMSFSDRNKRFKEVGIVDEKDNLNKDFVFQNITTRTAGGFQYREQVIDEQSLRSNVAYTDLLKANARGLMSQDIKQQKQFITGRLKWTSDTAKAYENATMEQREDFLIDQVLRKDLAAMGESREVTDEDIKNIPGLKKYIEKDGQKIPNRIYTKNIGKPTAVKVEEPEEGNKSEAPIIAKNYIDSFLKDPVSFLEDRFSVGEEGSFYKEMSFKDGLITVRPPDKEYEVKEGDETTIEFEEQEEKSFPINSSQGKRLLRDLIKGEVGGDKASREIMRIIDKTFPKGSKNSFTEALKNSTLFSPEQSKANQDFN